MEWEDGLSSVIHPKDSLDERHAFDRTLRSEDLRRIHALSNSLGVGHSSSSSSGVARRTQKRGVCNMLSLLPTTNVDLDGNRTIVDFRVYNEVSTWLAWYHVSTGMNPLSPEIQQRLDPCNVEFRLRMRDSRFSVLNAAREFLASFEGDFAPDTPNNTSSSSSSSNNDSNTLLDDLEQLVEPISTMPSVLIGAARSAVSTVLSFLSAAYGIPQVSSSSTAAYLDNKGTHPLFGRTVPTNKGDSKAMTAYFKNHLEASHVGILYIGDDYGTNFHADLVKEMVAAQIEVFSVRFDDTTIESAIQQLTQSDMRYIVAILNPSTWKVLIREAASMGILGQPDYFWLLSESSLEMVAPTFELDRDEESDLALALHGTGILSLTVPNHDAFDQAMIDFTMDEQMQQQYIDQHAEPEMFDNFNFSSTGRSIYQYLSYDAVTALAIAICEAPDGEAGEDAVVAGQRIYKQLLITEFEGASGYVSFEPETGTRRSENLIYLVQNLQLSDNSSSVEAHRFSSDVTALVNFNNPLSPIESQIPFLYASNSTTPPLALPPLEVDMNLVSVGVRVFGLALCAMVMLMSVWWMVWTIINRKKDVVRASQPIFLCQLCVGTIITASAIIPMSLQEPFDVHGLDIACMSVHWLISVGFVTSFSALFSKTWRLNKLFKHGRGMRRVIVRPHDVALPFCVLMTINLIVLILWTINAPVMWERVPSKNYDQFGRSVESVGFCQTDSDNHGVVYLVLSVVVNMSVLIFTIYQAYLARNLPTEFSESSYIAVAMASLLEVLMLGMPLLFLGSEEPAASFFIRSVLVFLACLSILLPIFLPKFIQRNVNQRFQEAQIAATGLVSTPRLRIDMVGSGVSGRPNSASFTGNALGDRQSRVSLGSAEMSLSSSINMTGTTRIRRNEEYFKERNGSNSVGATASNFERRSSNFDRHSSNVDRQSTSSLPHRPQSSTTSS